MAKKALAYVKTQVRNSYRTYLLTVLSRTFPQLSEKEIASIEGKILEYISDGIENQWSIGLVKQVDDKFDIRVLDIKHEQQEEEERSKVVLSQREPASYVTLRVAIQGDWLVNDMRDFLSCIEDIYNLMLTIHLVGQLQKDAGINFSSANKGRLSLLTGSPWIIPKHHLLKIQRIEYNSPGITDLAGLGVIIGHVKDFLLRVLELAATSKQRQLESQKLEIDNRVVVMFALNNLA